MSHPAPRAGRKRRGAVLVYAMLLLGALPARAGDPIGNVEGINGPYALGWSADTNAPAQSINVTFYVDGGPAVGTYAGSALTHLLRQDVNDFLGITGNHGFRWFIPKLFHDNTTHALYAYGVDVSGTVTNPLWTSPTNFCIPPYPQFSTDQPYMIGAWYFTAWSASNDFQAVNSESVYGRHDDWGGVRDHAEGADPWALGVDYSSRRPLLGFYDMLNQEIVDTHIRQAASAGLSFFAFYWYWNSDTHSESPISYPAHTYVSSPIKQRMRFLIAPITLGAYGLSLSEWKTQVVPFMTTNYLADPTYLTTKDGAPVVVMFWPRFTNDADYAEGISYLRSYVAGSLGKAPLVLSLYVSDTNSVDYLASMGAEGFAAFHTGPSTPAEPYAISMSQWNHYTAPGEGYFSIPCGTTGFDRRPWWKIGWSSTNVNEDNYNTDITLGAFSNHMNNVKTYLDSHPDETGKAALIYAWNEWGEGGIMEPSSTLGYSYLDCVQTVFGLKSRLARGPASLAGIEKGSTSVSLDVRNLTPGITNCVEQASSLGAANNWSFFTNFVSGTTQTNMILGWTNTWNNAFFRITTE